MLSLHALFGQLLLRPVMLSEMKIHLPVSLCSFAVSILLFFPFTRLASGAATNPPTPSVLALNQSNPESKNLLPSTLGESTYHCSNEPMWTATGWNPAECQLALLRLALSESDRHGDEDFEFMGPGSFPTSRNPKMVTPRRYTSGELEPFAGGDLARSCP